MGDHKFKDSNQSPTKENVKRERSSLKRVFDPLQKSHEYRGSRVKKLMAEKRCLLARINDDRKESKFTLMLSSLMLRNCIQIPLC